MGAIPVGAPVCCHSLNGAPELNGRNGKITGWDAGKKRYTVDIDNESKSLKPTNITQMCSFTIVEIASMPAINGSRAQIFGFQTQNGQRYEVELPQGKRMGIKPCNCQLDNGTRVVVQGIMSNESYNGKMASIKEVHKEALRYTVELETGEKIKIKYENVLA